MIKSNGRNWIYEKVYHSLRNESVCEVEMIKKEKQEREREEGMGQGRRRREEEGEGEDGQKRLFEREKNMINKIINIITK